MKIFLIFLILNLFSNQKFSSFTINYGSEENEIGIIFEPETPPIGPHSFSVDKSGNIYISDPVNSSIKIFSCDGKFLKVIPFKDFYDDLMVSPDGDIFILKRDSSEIINIKKDGKINRIKIETEISIEPSKLFLWKGEIFVRRADKVRLSSFKGGVSEKIPYIFIAEYMEKGKGIVRKIDSSGRTLLRFPLERENLVSIEFLNEDFEGNIYIQIEYLISENSVGLEVLRLNPWGEIISKISIPENDYSIWTSRLLFVDEKGRIFQVLPKREFVRVSVWQ